MSDTLTIETTEPIIKPEEVTQPLGNWDGPIPDPDKVPDDPEPIANRRTTRVRARIDREPDKVTPETEASKYLTVSGLARKGAFVKPLTQMYASIGAFVSLYDPQCGAVVLGQAQKCAESLDQLAQQKPEIARALVAMLEGGAWTAVIIAHAPILIAVLVHHVPAAQKILGERFAVVADLMAQQEEEDAG